MCQTQNGHTLNKSHFIWVNYANRSNGAIFNIPQLTDILHSYEFVEWPFHHIAHAVGSWPKLDVFKTTYIHVKAHYGALSKSFPMPICWMWWRSFIMYSATQFLCSRIPASVFPVFRFLFCFFFSCFFRHCVSVISPSVSVSLFICHKLDTKINVIKLQINRSKQMLSHLD